jgi:hypothetical protein
LKEADVTDERSPSNDLIIESNLLRPKIEEQKRAAEMASALDLLRSNDAADDIDDNLSLEISSVVSFKGINASSTGRSVASLPSALDWLKNKDKDTKPTADDQDEDEDDVDLALTRIMKESKEEKSSAEMAKALDWLRDGGEFVNDYKGLKSAGYDSFSYANSDVAGKSGIDNALNWLRKKHPESLSQHDDDGDEFSKLENSSPSSSCWLSDSGCFFRSQLSALSIPLFPATSLLA